MEKGKGGYGRLSLASNDSQIMCTLGHSKRVLQYMT
jgi:hypothetical protein